MSNDRRVEATMTEPEPGVAVVTLRLRVNAVPAEVFLTALTTIGREAQVAVDALTKLCEQLETVGELIDGDLFEKVEDETPGFVGVDMGAPEGDRASVVEVQPPAKLPAETLVGRATASKAQAVSRESDRTAITPRTPAAEAGGVAPSKISKEPNLPEADVPDGSPEWLAPALKRVKAAKTRTVLQLLAFDGYVTVQSVIYAFRPPIKETYASGILSDCKAVLGQVGWKLERDNTGAYRARISE